MESQYDDSLLATQENLENVDWDRVDGVGLVSEGKHLVEIENVSGYSHNFKEYTGTRAKLKMRVLAGLDAGKFVYDDLNLPHRKEKAGNQNRRLLIASRLGRPGYLPDERKDPALLPAYQRDAASRAQPHGQGS